MEMEKMSPHELANSHKYAWLVFWYDGDYQHMEIIYTKKATGEDSSAEQLEEELLDIIAKENELNDDERGIMSLNGAVQILDTFNGLALNPQTAEGYELTRMKVDG
jgi:hypothetical protein